MGSGARDQDAWYQDTSPQKRMFRVSCRVSRSRRSSLRRKSVPLASVSYTHLDVYKRQSGHCVKPKNTTTALPRKSAMVLT